MEGKKKLNISMKSVSTYIKNGVLVVSFMKPWKALSSAIFGGGFSNVNHIINIHVPKGYHSKYPEKNVETVVRKLKLEGNVIGMLTAANLHNVAMESEEKRGLKVTAIVTGGVSNATASGDEVEDWEHGTINIIILIDANITNSAMVNVVKTATEAKTLALHDLDVRSTKSSDIATGTSTDTIAIACSGKGEERKYAGTATVLGSMIGKIIRKAVREAIQKQNLIRR